MWPKKEKFLEREKEGHGDTEAWKVEERKSFGRVRAAGSRLDTGRGRLGVETIAQTVRGCWAWPPRIWRPRGPLSWWAGERRC